MANPGPFNFRSTAGKQMALATCHVPSHPLPIKPVTAAATRAVARSFPDRLTIHAARFAAAAASTATTVGTVSSANGRSLRKPSRGGCAIARNAGTSFSVIPSVLTRPPLTGRFWVKSLQEVPINRASKSAPKPVEGGASSPVRTWPPPRSGSRYCRSTLSSSPALSELTPVTSKPGRRRSERPPGGR